MDDDALLQEYVKRRSEKAFAELVARHVNLVYSTALRIVQNPALAKDVSQSVFIRLALKAATIRSGNALPGWLYRVARCQAINAVRAERTRIKHETEAVTMNANDTESTATWTSILPHLDEAMDTLTATDQSAVVLRYFQGRSWREIGGALALNEDTAQKRVSRAVEKLRAHFLRRGIVTSTLLIGSAIAANAVQAAPSGLAAPLAFASLAGAAGASSFNVFLTHVQAVFLKKATWLLCGLLAVGVATPAIIHEVRHGSAVTESRLRKDLVLHYSFDQREVDDKITDASDAKNHGRAVGAHGVRDGKRGGTFQFSPPGEYIRVPNADSLNPSCLTLAVWVKTANRDDTWRRIFDKGYSTSYALSIGGGHTRGNQSQGKAAIEIAMGLNRNRGFASSDEPVTDGQWHHLAATYNGTEQCLYVDGVLQKQVAHWSGNIPPNAHDLTIGLNLIDPNAGFNEVGASFDGLMDDPMIFSRALSSEEVTFIFNSQQK